MPHPRSPKTCFVLPDGHGLGGVTNWTIQQARALTKLGHRCEILEHVNTSLGWKEATPPELAWRTIYGRHPGVARPEDVPVFAYYYGEAVPAVVVPNYTDGAYAACAAVAMRHPESIRVLGVAHTDQGYYYDLLQHYEPILTLILAVSEEIADRLRQLLPHRSDDIRVRPYGVAVPTHLKRTWSKHGQPLRITYAGRIVEEQKRVLDLPRLAERLDQKGVDFALHIYGTGDTEPLLQAAIARLPASTQGRIHLEGRARTDSMNAVWAKSDIAVLMSEFEGTSISMLEAMAQGCVPVVTRVSGTRQAILDGLTGLTIPIGDVEAMASGIAALAMDRAQVESMGRAAHAHVRDQFGLQSYTAWFADLIDEAWSKAPRTTPAGFALLRHTYEEAPVPQPAPYVRYSLKRFLGKVRKRIDQWVS